MKASKDGLNYWCKKCMSEKKKTWVEANRERVRSNDNAWRASNPERVKAHYVKSLYGLTTEEREALGDTCHICGEGGGMVVDHDHACCPGSKSCGKCVRGVLCRKCNLAIGHFDDDVERIRSAIKYLEAVK
jgi:hypothetical protein